MKLDIFKKVTTSVKTHSPEILIVSGVVGTVTSVVLACKATLKVNDILEESKVTIDTIHKVKEEKKEKYTEKDAKRDLAIVYVQTGVKLAKLYAPAVILGTLSLTSIIASNNILRKRNMALAAAYTTVDKAYKEYRRRVVEKYGEEVDKELTYGTKTEKIEEEVVDEETGKTKKVKKTVTYSTIEGCSPYAIYLDKYTSSYVERNDDYNMMLIRSTQNYMNDILRVKGTVTLKDVLDTLGVLSGPEYERMKKAALVVGWKYEKDNPIGDNVIKFDVIDTYRKHEDGSLIPTKIIDFNVDGNIYDRM